MFEVWLQMSDTNIDTENPSDLPALGDTHRGSGLVIIRSAGIVIGLHRPLESSKV